MKKDVYKHLWNTYGRLPLLWIGIVAEIIRSLLLRIVSVVIASYISYDIASGNIEGVKRNILLFVILYTIGAVIGVIGELMCVYTTDERYKILLAKYYQKIVGKDMSFYRDHQTGYLASLFRQHLDGTMSLVRILRGMS